MGQKKANFLSKLFQVSGMVFLSLPCGTRRRACWRLRGACSTIARQQRWPDNAGGAEWRLGFMVQDAQGAQQNSAFCSWRDIHCLQSMRVHASHARVLCDIQNKGKKSEPLGKATKSWRLRTKQKGAQKERKQR